MHLKAPLILEQNIHLGDRLQPFILIRHGATHADRQTNTRGKNTLALFLLLLFKESCIADVSLSNPP